jgi:hypothetical protein
VLILPPGHAQSVSGRAATTRREQLILRGVLFGVLALALVVIVSLASGSSTARRGCIDVTIASSLGGQPIAGCGARARSLCRQVNVRGGFTAVAGAAVAAACRRSGLAVGAAASGGGG